MDAFRVNDDNDELDDFPALDFEQIVFGAWSEHKKPSSAAVRRFLAAVTRLYRDVPRSDGHRLQQLATLRQLHQKHRAELIAMEVEYSGVRERTLRAFNLWKAKPQGGIQ